MPFFLFPREELREVFERLGYDYPAGTAKRNAAYYDQRTSHGSTLNFVAHAGVLAALDLKAPRSGSWSRCTAMPTTSRAARRRKAST
jgi:trehalose/maltose hydrolase-like predicted phosphorylase